MAKPLSATMIDAIELAQQNGGELVRYQGGFWAARTAPRGNDGIPRPYHGASTIQGLIDRGEAAYSEWREGRGGEFPIAMKLADPRP